jgi:hypothetical protein
MITQQESIRHKNFLHNRCDKTKQILKLRTSDLRRIKGME